MYSDSDSPSPPRPRRKKFKDPQSIVDSFWKRFAVEKPGKVLTILPNNPYSKTKASQVPQGLVQGIRAIKSYEQAKRECEKAVEKIAKQCRRANIKYRDVFFDIEFDLKRGTRQCLDGLINIGEGLQPKAVKRVSEIYDNPEFFIGGTSEADVVQGRDGDCWLMAALSAMANKDTLIERVCVARDEAVGAYGFVFYRDGEWQQTIIDDKLYLTYADYDESKDEREIWGRMSRLDAEEEYRRAYQTGSRALYFASCRDPNETWLPLLEKAYAKAHGDYESIDGGYICEAIEDLTGGVTSQLLTSDILDQDLFWKHELMKVNEEFLWGCATGFYADWIKSNKERVTDQRKGIHEMHTYSIIEAKEVKGERLLKLRNPWGRGEWKGKWSDGSEEWTAEWIQILNHKFGDDGVFWISYSDFLRQFQLLDRTRLFGDEWTITQQWTTLHIPWRADYHDTKFEITLNKASQVVIVLTQLDTRYFRGFQGQYIFKLHFRVQNDEDGEYIMRSGLSYFMTRSTSVELDLEPGKYSVSMKITTERWPRMDTVKDTIKQNCKYNMEKLIRIGLSYDLAHAKGRYIESEEEKRQREARERKKGEEEIMRRILTKREQLYKKWERKQKMHKREKKRERRKKEKKARKAIDLTSITNVTKESSDESDMPTTKPATVEDKTEQVSKIEPARQLDEHPKEVPLSDSESDADSLSTFDFDPELDLTNDESSTDDGIEKTTADGKKKSKKKKKEKHKEKVKEGLNEEDDDLSSDEEELTRNPWNAVCVVGLRVYSKDQVLSLEVVRLKDEDEVGPSLDVDNPAASAVVDAAKSHSDDESVPEVVVPEVVPEVVVPEVVVSPPDGALTEDQLADL
ncbi:MAG: hypothetical protein M1834_008332 [Cirrosporium novae-zelandiae]|nr:MAG: hypothetical protein M1834_008332 [Cirrosporium novae-zelandiae]